MLTPFNKMVLQKEKTKKLLDLSYFNFFPKIIRNMQLLIWYVYLIRPHLESQVVLIIFNLCFSFIPILQNIKYCAFSCIALFMFIKKYHNHLGPHALRCIFFGYAPNKRGYNFFIHLVEIFSQNMSPLMKVCHTSLFLSPRERT